MTSLTEFHNQIPNKYSDSGGFHTRAGPQSAEHGLDQSFIPAKCLFEVAMVSVRDFFLQFEMTLLKNL
jgi:hypothetical protein